MRLAKWPKQETRFKCNKDVAILKATNRLKTSQTLTICKSTPIWASTNLRLLKHMRLPLYHFNLDWSKRPPNPPDCQISKPSLTTMRGNTTTSKSDNRQTTISTKFITWPIWVYLENKTNEFKLLSNNIGRWIGGSVCS